MKTKVENSQTLSKIIKLLNKFSINALKYVFRKYYYVIVKLKLALNS